MPLFLSCSMIDQATFNGYTQQQQAGFIEQFGTYVGARMPAHCKAWRSNTWRGMEDGKSPQ